MNLRLGCERCEASARDRITVGRYLGGVAGQAVELCVRKFLAFDGCLRSVGAERNRGNPVILFASCFVLADGAGTVLARFLCQWNLCDASRVFPYCSAVYCESRRLVGLPTFPLIALRLCQPGCC